MTVMGAAITALSSTCILIPNKIVGGGVTGISNTLYHAFDLPAGITFALINLCLLVIGYKILGKDFTLKTLLGAGLTSLFMELFAVLPPITTNEFIATLFGGIMYGFGISVTLVAGASTGGTDILGRLIQHFFPHMSIGKLLMAVDGLVILLSQIVFRDGDLALLGVVALILSTQTIDGLISKLNAAKMAFVITDIGEEMAAKLVAASPRGVTILKGIGAYSLTKKNVLFCSMKDYELETFRNRVLEIDPQAFVVFADVQMIQGNGFLIYK